MKKLFLASAIALMAISAHAEEWVTVSTNPSGLQLQVNTDSVTAGNNGTEVWAGGFFRFVNPKENLDVRVTYMLPSKTCKNKTGVIKMKDMTPGVDNIEESTWTQSGTHMYDSAARAICIFVEKRHY